MDIANIRLIPAFLESYDSVRYAPLIVSPNAHDEHLLHARLETLLSILLGFPIMVSEPYSFDSMGFLKVATEVIEARRRAYGNRASSWATMAETPVFNPFVLRTITDMSYDDMLSRRFSQEKFILSSIPELDRNSSLREKIARAFNQWDYGTLKKYFPSGRQENLELINAVREYFFRSQPGLPVPLMRTVPPHVPLGRYSNWLLRVPVTRTLPVEFHTDVLALRRALRLFKKRQVPLTDRSQIRLEGEKWVQAGHLDQQSYLLALEFVDSCYNRVIASAVDADIKSHSTGGAGVRASTATGEAISALAHSVLTRRQQTWDDLSLVIDPPMNDDLRIFWGNDWRTKTLDWGRVWERMWSIIAQTEWRDKVLVLHTALRSVERSRAAVEDALGALTSYISHDLRSVRFTSTDRGKLSLSAPILLSVGAKLVVYQFDLPTAWGVVPDLLSLRMILKHTGGRAFSRGFVEASLRLEVR